MDDLTASGIHPMIWSPLAGGRMFDPNDSLCATAMKTIKRIAEKHDADPSAIIYAWIMYHPAGAVPISGSNRLDRLDKTGLLFRVIFSIIFLYAFGT